MAHQLQRENPQQRRPVRQQDAAARAGALAARLPQLVVGNGPGRVEQHRRLSAHRRQRRAQRLGALRLRQDAGLPLGHFSRAGRARSQNQFRRAHGPAGVAGSPGRIPLDPAPDHRHPGRHRTGIGRAAAPPRPHLPLALRPAQPVPGQRRGGPPPVGHGLPAARALRPRRPRGRRSAACAPLGRRRQSAHPHRVQREDPGLAFVLHVHLHHRPRRQIPARRAGRVRFRSAVAHLPLHADRGSAPHVRGRIRHRPHHPAHLRRDERAQDRGRGQAARPGGDRSARPCRDT